MSKCYLLFAEGLEECEGLITLDILRRAGLETYTVSVEDAHTVVGAHGVPVTCDRTLPELLAAPPELVVLPGGMPGTTNLRANERVCELTRQLMSEKRLGAICAAPSILAELGLLDGRVATCYPGCEGAFPAGVRPEELGVYTDDNLVTASGPGFAVDFGLALLELLEGAEAAQRIAAGMLVGR